MGEGRGDRKQRKRENRTRRAVPPEHFDDLGFYLKSNRTHISEIVLKKNKTTTTEK